MVVLQLHRRRKSAWSLYRSPGAQSSSSQGSYTQRMVVKWQDNLLWYWGETACSFFLLFQDADLFKSRKLYFRDILKWQATQQWQRGRDFTESLLWSPRRELFKLVEFFLVHGLEMAIHHRGCRALWASRILLQQCLEIAGHLVVTWGKGLYMVEMAVCLWD